MRGRTLRAARAGAAALGAHSLAGAAHARLSAPDERRHAPAHRRRHRAGRRAEADHRRRAHHQSRCHDPGAVPRSAEGPPARHRRGDHLRHPQPRHRRAHVRPDGGDVRRQDRRARLGAEPVQRRRSIPTRARCSARSRSSAARSRCMRSPASRPISRACRRAAHSIRAAPMRCRNARSRNRRRHGFGEDWTARCWRAAAQPAKEAYDRASA